MTNELRIVAAAALRDLNHAFVAHEADSALLERIAVFARDAAAELRVTERRDLAPLLSANVGRLFRVDSADETAPSPANFMTDRAVGGESNPTSAEFEFGYEADEVVVRTTLGAAYEGAPGRAHGGMVAALFDDITGFLLPLAGTPGYTGQLSVRYVRPVPIETPLEFRTRIESRQRRKLHVTAECSARDELVATAEALFITVDVGRFGQSS